MQINVFLEDLKDVLQREDDVNLTDKLEDYDEWDSLSKMAVMAYFDDRFGIKIGLNDFDDINLISDLIELSRGGIA